MNPIFYFYILCFIACMLLVAEIIYFWIADKCNIVDKPNERSSHTKVVLRGGGIIFGLLDISGDEIVVMVWNSYLCSVHY